MGSIHLLLIYNLLLLALDNRHRETTHLILIYEQLPNYIIDMYQLYLLSITKHRGSSSFISPKQIRGNKQCHGQRWPRQAAVPCPAPRPAHISELNDGHKHLLCGASEQCNSASGQRATKTRQETQAFSVLAANFNLALLRDKGFIARRFDLHNNDGGALTTHPATEDGIRSFKS